MPSSRLERTFFIVGLGAIVALLMALVDASMRYEDQSAALVVEAAPTVRDAEPVRLRPAPQVDREMSRAAPRPPTMVRLAVAAPRGDCWIEVRERDSTGDVLYSGIVQRGDIYRVTAKQLWIRFGAAVNVDMTLNGRRERLAAEVVNVVVTPRGVRPAPA